MSSPLSDGMMRTSEGVRIAVRPALFPTSAGAVIVTTSGLEFRLTLDESHALRDTIQAAELRAARGDVIT